MNRRKLSVMLLTLTALLLVGTASALAAPVAPQESGESGARTVLFGEVVGNDAGVLTVRTEDGDVTVTLSGETKVRGRGGDEEGTGQIAVGDRVAIVVVEGTAQSILVKSAQRKARARVVHVSGVVAEITEDGAIFVMEDGTERKVAFGLSAPPPEPGTVVTLTGRVDGETGTLQVRSVHPLRKTIERLNGHIDELDQATTDRSDRLHRLRRVQQLLERNSGRQVQVLTRVAEKLPVEAQAGLARAIEALEEANQGVARAFERALKMAGDAERERRDVDDLSKRRLPKDAKPTFEDVAAVLGMSEEALSASLNSTGNEVALEGLGKTPDELHEGIVARIEERLSARVEAGEMTAEAMALVLDQVRERIAELISSIFRESAVHDELPFSVEDLAGVIGVGPEALFARLRGGATPLDVARGQGVSRDELIEKLRAITEERARSLVDDGALAEKDLERFMERFMGSLGERLSEAKGRRGPERDESEDRKKEREREEDVRKIPFDLKVLAELFGTDGESVRKLLVSGRTLAEIASEHGVTVEAMAGRLLEETKRKLGRQIESGHITDEEAAALIERSRSSFVERLRRFRLEDRGTGTRAGGQATGARIHRPYAGVELSVDEIADAIGIRVEELRELMAERGGIGRLLEARGVSAEDVVAKLLGLVERRLAARADTSEGAGELAGERARKQLSELKSRLLEDLGGRTKRVEPTRRSVDTAAAKAVLGFIPFDLQVVARVSDIAPQRLRELLRERTIAQIAERAGVPLSTIVDALMLPLEKRAQNAAAAGTPREQIREKIAAAREEFLTALRRFKLPESAVRREIEARDARRGDRTTAVGTAPLRPRDAPTGLRPAPTAPAPVVPPTATPAASEARVTVPAVVATACGLKTRDWAISDWRALRGELIACQDDLLASLKTGIADVNERAAAVRAEAPGSTADDSTVDDSTADDGDRASLPPADDAPAAAADDAPVADEIAGELFDALAGGLSDHGTITDWPVATDAEARVLRLAERFDTLRARIAQIEKRLSTVADDAALADTRLQNALAQQQRTLQTLSSVSKAVHDIAMKVIQNLRA